MIAIPKKIIGIAALCFAATAGAQTQPSNTTSGDVAHPTGTTGATAFQPSGPSKAEADANTGSSHGDSGFQQHKAKPGFDNKPPKGAKSNCHQPQGGVDASGGENVSTASKDNTTCTGKAGQKPSDKK